MPGAGSWTIRELLLGRPHFRREKQRDSSSVRDSWSRILNVDRIRADLPAIRGVRYFNTGGIGPMPRPVWATAAGELNAALDIPVEPMTWAAGVATRIPQLRSRVAAFFDVEPSEVAFVRSVSEAYNIVLWGRSWKPGDVIVTSSEEHQSGMMPVRNLCARLPGLAIRFFQIGASVPATLENYRRALEDGATLVAVSHVTTDTGTLLPVAEMTRLAHAAGAEILVDGAQAAGQFPVSLRDLGVDYYAGIGSKWLMGPIGTGFLYVRESRLRDLSVTWTGFTAETWYRHPDGTFEFHRDARKFEYGARHWPLYFGFGAALDYLAGLGVDEIARRSHKLADALRMRLVEIPGVRLLGPEDSSMQTPIMAFAIAGASPEQVSSELRSRYQIVQRAAPFAGGVRLCVAWFNTDEESEVVAEAVAALARPATRLLAPPSSEPR